MILGYLNATSTLSALSFVLFQTSSGDSSGKLEKPFSTQRAEDGRKKDNVGDQFTINPALVPSYIPLRVVEKVILRGFWYIIQMYMYLMLFGATDSVCWWSCENFPEEVGWRTKPLNNLNWCRWATEAGFVINKLLHVALSSTLPPPFFISQAPNCGWTSLGSLTDWLSYRDSQCLNWESLRVSLTPSGTVLQRCVHVCVCMHACLRNWDTCNVCSIRCIHRSYYIS